MSITVSCSFCLTKAAKLSTGGRRINSQCYLRSCRANQAPALWPDPAQQNGGNASVELTPNPTIWELAFAVYLSCSENHRSLTPCGLRAGSYLEKLDQPLANQLIGTHHILNCIGGGSSSGRHCRLAIGRCTAASPAAHPRQPNAVACAAEHGHASEGSLIPPPKKKIGLKRTHH